MNYYPWKQLRFLVFLSLGLGFIVPNVQANDLTKVVKSKNFKYRIMIDKVNGTPKLKESEFALVAAQKFNIICPRHGAEDPVTAERSAKLAGKYNLMWMGWLRGTLRTSDKDDQYTLEDGFTFNICSPNSKRLYDTLKKRIMTLAKLSLRYPVLGAFMDFELYARPLPKTYWCGHAYTFSYDLNSLKSYCRTKGIKLPPLTPDKRADWLNGKGKLDDYKQWQINEWRKSLHELRATIDKVNPDFQFAIYPGRCYTRYIDKAVWPELSTKQAPAICAEHYTYGKGAPKKDTNKNYWKISDEEGLKLNNEFIIRRRNIFRSSPIPFKIIGGLDPIDKGGKNPVFMAATAVQMSKIGNGYWVFYEGLKTNSILSKKFEKWFTIANEAIENGTFHMRVY